MSNKKFHSLGYTPTCTVEIHLYKQGEVHYFDHLTATEIEDKINAKYPIVAPATKEAPPEII